jgi:hypothetical protein
MARLARLPMEPKLLFPTLRVQGPATAAELAVAQAQAALDQANAALAQATTRTRWCYSSGLEAAMGAERQPLPRISRRYSVSMALWRRSSPAIRLL